MPLRDRVQAVDPYSSNAPAACTAARSNGGRPPCVVTGSRFCPTGALAVTPCERTVRWISRHSNPCIVRLSGQPRRLRSPP